MWFYVYRKQRPEGARVMGKPRPGDPIVEVERNAPKGPPGLGRYECSVIEVSQEGEVEAVEDLVVAAKSWVDAMEIARWVAFESGHFSFPKSRLGMPRYGVKAIFDVMATEVDWGVTLLP